MEKDKEIFCENLEDEMLEETVEGTETASWIFTFADMMTLILTFFVLLFSMSKMEVEKFKGIMMSVQQSFGEHAPSIEKLKLSEEDKGQQKEAEDDKLLIDESRLEADQSLKMEKDIMDFITKRGLNKHIVVSVDNENIILRVKDAILFPSGKALLNEKAKPILDDIKQILDKYLDYRVRIAGHTDNVPINTVQFPSNWELSAIRATTVLRYLLQKGVETDRLTATGYGDLLQVAPNDTPENRALNRRVEFVLEKEK